MLRKWASSPQGISEHEIFINEAYGRTMLLDTDIIIKYYEEY